MAGEAACWRAQTMPFVCFRSVLSVFVLLPFAVIVRRVCGRAIRAFAFVMRRLFFCVSARRATVAMPAAIGAFSPIFNFSVHNINDRQHGADCYYAR